MERIATIADHTRQPTTLMLCQGCHTQFIQRHGNQRYCSPRCQARSTHQRYRETHRAVLRARTQASRQRAKERSHHDEQSRERQ